MKAAKFDKRGKFSYFGSAISTEYYLFTRIKNILPKRSLSFTSQRQVVSKLFCFNFVRLSARADKL